MGCWMDDGEISEVKVNRETEKGVPCFYLKTDFTRIPEELVVDVLPFVISCARE